MTKKNYIVETNLFGEEEVFCKECGCPVDECCCNTHLATYISKDIEGNAICSLYL